MICEPCKNRDHEGCPEVARQADPYISELEKSASHLCYCAHQDGAAARPEREPAPRRDA